LRAEEIEMNTVKTNVKTDVRMTVLSGAVLASAAWSAGAQQISVPIVLDASSTVAAELCIGPPLSMCSDDATQLLGGFEFIIDQGAGTITVVDYSVNTQDTLNFFFGGLGTSVNATLTPFTADYPAAPVATPVPGIIQPDGTFEIQNVPGVLMGTATAMGTVAFIINVDETIDLSANGELTGTLSGQIIETSPNQFTVTSALSIGTTQEFSGIEIGIETALDLSGSGTGVPIDDPCPADFNGDGTVNVLDVVSFITNWNAGGPGSDFNGDGNVNILDVVGFITVWNGGCP
jgi:hypothetical protein